MKIVLLEYLRQYTILFMHCLEGENYEVHVNNSFYFEISALLF